MTEYVSKATAADGEPVRANQRSGRAATRAAVPVIGQAKLVVGSASDPHEREADEMADQVMRSLRRDGGVRTLSSTPRVRRSLRSPQVGAAGGPLDSDTEQRLQRARSGGTPLVAGLQRSIGEAMGADVSNVRLHSGAESSALNAEMGARAFTLGNDVFLGDGAPSTDTDAGLRLVAHEVAHTVQQGASPVQREMDEVGSTAPAAAPAASSPDEEAPVEMAGELPTVKVAAVPEDTTGGGVLEEDQTHAGRGGSHRSGSTRQSGSRRGRTTAPITARIGTSTRVSEKRGLVEASDTDAAVGRAIATKTSVAGYTATSFGSMRTTITIEGTTWELKDDKVYIDCTINGQLFWGVDAGGRTDVPSPTAPLVTKDNFTEIADDLNPKLDGKSWRARRKKYWSAALTGRHELYHANDAAGYINREGAGVLTDYLSKNPITLSEDDKKDPAAVKTKVDAAVHAGLQEVIAGRTFYFRAGMGKSDYLNFPGEIRAFGDGKQPYADLASGVRAHGQGLADAAKPKPTAATATATPSVTAPTPVTAGASL